MSHIVYIHQNNKGRGISMYATFIVVAIVHHAWMALFMYSWILLVRDNVRQVLLYFSIFCSTLAAWRLYGACPITELETALTHSAPVGWIQIGSFCFVLAITSVATMKILKKVRTWTQESVVDYLRAQGLVLGCVLLWLSLIVSRFNFFAEYTWASLGIACAVLAPSFAIKLRYLYTTRALT